jgi:2-polyprenyl-6-methoxyphenol hydroxylase-like FAD-dependent oxidoreductase
MPAAQTALVIGGGIAGPVAATALTMAGIDAAVYEARMPDPCLANGIGGSLALEPNGLAALRIVGADDAVRAAAVPITRSVMSIASKPGREMPTPQGLGPRQLIDRGAPHRILRDRAEQAAVRIHDAKKLIRVDERPDGVTAHFADGSSASADVLIGADGVHSTVRRLIDPAAPGARYLGLLGFEGIVEDAIDDPATASRKSGTMTFAFGRRAYYLTGSGPTAASAGARICRRPSTSASGKPAPCLPRLHTLRTAYANDVPGARLAAETNAETLQGVGGLHIMPPVPHWHRGRMVLVGDAVHAPSNSTGQGGSLAMESAIQLARCLRDISDVPAAFATYERLRRPRVEKIAARGARLSHAKAPGPIAQRMMQLMLPIVMATMNIEKTMTAEQSYTIDWNAAAQEDQKALA